MPDHPTFLHPFVPHLDSVPFLPPPEALGRLAHVTGAVQAYAVPTTGAGVQRLAA